MGRMKRAFTLIELLVVVAIIALLIGILLPALGQARMTAKGIVAGSMARQLAIGVTYYSNDYKGFIPGLTTSTTALSIRAVKEGVDITDLMNSDSTAPVQNWDWIMPSVGQSDPMPVNWVQRFVEVLERFDSPGMDMQFAPYGNVDGDDLDYIDTLGGVRGTSWLQPGGLIWWGSKSFNAEAWRLRARYGRVLFTPAHSLSANQVQVRPDYKPNFDAMPTPTAKVLCADGFRYWTESDGPDVSIEWDGLYGSFGTSSPIYEGSTAYNVNGPGYQLSYRYAERMNAAFADGHVDMLTVRESHNPALWYPSGSIFAGGSGTVQGAFEFYEPGDRLN
jgi:prepilin-type N-terminal cleavage/methylation domain-containing protein/prepilin-type processing-associated H-X9-DG protein